MDIKSCHISELQQIYDGVSASCKQPGDILLVFLLREGSISIQVTAIKHIIPQNEKEIVQENNKNQTYFK